MTVSWPRYTAAIIRILAKGHGMSADDAMECINRQHPTVWWHYGRNTPEAAVAAELHGIVEHDRKRRREAL